MNLTTPVEGKLMFYVVNNLNHQQMGEKLTLERRLTLPQAIALYNSYRPDQASAIGAMLEGGAHINILRRCTGANALVTDYQKLDRWRYNPKLCVSAVNMQRSTGTRTLKLEVEGSDKRFSFSMQGNSGALMVTESAIDTLSVATILQHGGQRWQSCHYLSLGGISAKQKSDELPMALGQYLHDHPAIRSIRLMLDNDEAGRAAAQRILARVGCEYDVKAVFPRQSKDFNEELMASGDTRREVKVEQLR